MNVIHKRYSEFEMYLILKKVIKYICDPVRHAGIKIKEYILEK